MNNDSVYIRVRSNYISRRKTRLEGLKSQLFASCARSILRSEHSEVNSRTSV